jgi:hypothetical protein
VGQDRRVLQAAREAERKADTFILTM